MPTKPLKIADVVVAFARNGIALYTIARALALPVAHVETICKQAHGVGELQMIPPRFPDDVRNAMLAEVVNLRAQLDDAQANVRERAEAREEFESRFYGVARLTRTEAAFVGLLVNRGKVSKERIYSEMYDARVDREAPEPKVLDVVICNVRRKLTRHGVEIKTHYGMGWEMTPENVARLEALAGLPEVASPPLVPGIAA